MKIAVLVAVLIVGALIWRSQQAVRPGASGSAADAGVAHSPAGGPHEDHDPKHGGTFFMAMNNHHHLEGVLEAPGVFRLYVYDSYTKPLPPEQMKQVSGRVLVGDADNPPELPLALSRDGDSLEATLGDHVTLPVTLTVLMRFPGMTMEARPELFTFPFRQYSKP
jgi:hypothetical protein